MFVDPAIKLSILFGISDREMDYRYTFWNCQLCEWISSPMNRVRSEGDQK